MDNARRREAPKQARKRGPRCPTCHQPLPDELGPRAPCRPFCSDRCKLVDLGKWLGGDHAIPGEPVADVDVGDEES